MVVHIHQEIEAALSSLPALLSLKGINKRRLPFLNFGCMIVPEYTNWAIRSTKIWLSSGNRWNVLWVIDCVMPLIFPHELWGEI